MRFPEAFLALALLALPASATPKNKQAVAALFGPHLPNRLNDCRLCHLPETKDDEERPHNAFGLRLVALKKTLKDAGKSAAIEDRVAALFAEDSDGDGTANLDELLLGRFPGDKTDKPTVEELKTLAGKRAAFEKFRTGYPWRPWDAVKKPPLPKPPESGWARNPIDAFIAAEHAERGLKPRPEAPRDVLLRRLYLDLTGLPPSPEAQAAFAKETSPDAVEKLVDALLASPRYGERWARHWMDVWRYSDWAGFGAEVRDSQPHVWRWRDWIVESLNENKGYDRMVQEMLAGDEIAPTDEKVLRATGFLVRNYKRYGRENWIQETVDHTFLAFQAATLNCARCHDHMYDPFAQQDYFRVRAIFEPHNIRLDRRPGQPNTQLDGLARIYDATPDAKTFLFIRGDERTPEKEALTPGVPPALGGKFAPQPIPLPREAITPDRRPFVMQELIASLKKTLELHDADLAKAEKRAAWLPKCWAPDLESLRMHSEGAQLAVEKNELLAMVEAAEDRGAKDEAEALAKKLTASERRFAFVLARNKLYRQKHYPPAAKPGEKLDPAKLLAEAEKALAKAEADLKLPPSANYTKRTVVSYPGTSTGRRLAFAQWLTARENPLAARVAVNHIWLRHFGTALVPSVFDFGRNGRPPTHPALLDWLAAELMEKNWDMKALHRMIVLSATYRQSSTPDAENLKRDPDNLYHWRFGPHRLEAEAIRDAIFAVAGKLDETRGGPDLDHEQGLTIPRRSLYFRTAAEKQMEFLKLFDGPSVVECYQRRESIVPTQALALFNSDLAIGHARILARKLHRQHEGAPAFTDAAFTAVLGRKPTVSETTECGKFLDDQAKATTAKGPFAAPDDKGLSPAADPALRAREMLVLVLFNHHEFVTVR